ncbi:cadherin-like domain-containing protein [Crocinitomicaceae bacterium]|nr:cadherin-like domain-containing protein [Crocinitomicaceae bacterium]
MAIHETPEFIPDTGIPDPGTDGAWNSSFTFGGLPSVAASSRMTDNGALVTGSDGVARGSSLDGDGYAGTIDIVVTGTTFSVNSMQVDTIFGTAGGDFAQTMPIDFSVMGGTINQTTGAMTFTPTDRTGSISAPNTLFDLPWNIDDVSDPSNTSWELFTTGAATNSAGTVNGATVTPIGDVNGDTITDYNVILVSASQVGQSWGTFAGASEIEIWNADLLSVSPRAVDDTDAVSVLSTQSIDVLANDEGTPVISITAVTNGSLGTVAIDPGNLSLSYTSTGVTGSDSFTYTIQDGDSNTDSATVSVTVASSPAIANDDTATTDQEQLAVINVIANDSTSAPGEVIDGATVSILTPVSNGNTVNNNDGTVDYSPNSGYVGTDSFTYEVQDTAGNLSNSATVTVTISAAALVSAGTYGPGVIAQSVGSTNGQIASSVLPPDTAATSYCSGGCYDFIITGATNPTSVVLPPLRAPVPEFAVLRKYDSATDIWRDFDTATTGDTVASAPLTAGGGCPSLNDVSWEPWNGASASSANTGHECLRYSLADNGAGPGPNDFDPAPGVIADPSGISVFVPVDNSDRATLGDFDSSGGGCSLAASRTTAASHIEWWLLAGFVAILGLFRSRNRARLSM